MTRSDPHGWGLEKRCLTPRETLERVSRLMPVLGITRIANVTGLDRIGNPVVTVCRPNSRSLSVAQGKGPTLDAAKASGLMESIEQYHAERITLPLKLATHNELRFTHPMADVDRLPRTNVSAFSDDLPLLWIESLDIVAGGRFWIPYELVHLDMTLPLPPGSGCFPLSSNGLASGNHPLEAFIHAVCEVIERDATTLWRYSPREEHGRRLLDLASVDVPACRELVERFERAQIALKVWEITSEIGVPVFYAKIAERAPMAWGTPPAAGGIGCHPSRGAALLRALAEAAQSRLTAISGSRDDMAPEDFSPAGPPTGGEVSPPMGGPRRRFDDAPSFEGESLEEDLSFLLDQLVAAGFERVLAVDLAKKGLDVPVVRVVIPGLEGFCDQPGFAPGARLRARLAERADAERGG